MFMECSVMSLLCLLPFLLRPFLHVLRHVEWTGTRLLVQPLSGDLLVTGGGCSLLYGKQAFT